MSDIVKRLQETRALICSGIKANKSLAYSTLLQLQHQQASDSTSIDALAEFSRDLIRLIVSDTQDEDEEIAAKALKCMGFIIYHPSMIAAMPVEEANIIFESLAELIITTKIKSICNLGVWCISIQQLDSDFLSIHFNYLLLAVVHALDNPNGSLSTTFEAIQAITKLAAQLSDKMRESCNIWAPPIYRRLLSSNKRERDMSERCLFKLKSSILPPPLVLSKALVKDMESLLIGMDKLLNMGMKVQTAAAWGWFIRILGSHSMKNRPLLNEMLKVTERIFSDHDPQVQIASQVAWEGLIDILVHHPNLLHEINVVKAVDCNQTLHTLNGNNSEIQANRFLKCIKLIMVPLIGMQMSKCDLSVRFSCLNTWYYLLYKLETFVNNPSMIKVVLEPMLEAIFQLIPNDENIRLWNMCLSIIDDCLLAKFSHSDNEVTAQLCYKSAEATSKIEDSGILKRSWKQYPVRWLPWNLNQLDFHLKMICIITTSASVEAISNENRTFAYDACLRLFKSVLKGVQFELKNLSVNYDDVMFCMKKILRFLRQLFEDINAEACIRHHLHYAILHFVEAVTKELEPAILGSPLYEMELDLKEVDTIRSVNICYLHRLGIYSISYMDMVSPMVYLVVLYYLVAVCSTLTTSPTDFILQDMHKYYEFVFSSLKPPENLVATISILYKNIGVSSLKIWIAIANGFTKSSLMMNNVPSRTKFDATGERAIYHFLSYPFVVCSSKESFDSPLEKAELESVMKVWKSLYGFVNTLQLECSMNISFIEDLASMLSEFLDSHHMLECLSEPCSSSEAFSCDFLSIYLDAVINILEGLQVSESSDRIMNKEKINCKESSCISSSLNLTARFMKLLWIELVRNPSSGFFASRVFSALAQFVSCLHLTKDIFIFIETVSSPLLSWLTKMEILDESINSHLQILWTEIISSLRRGSHSLATDTALLKLFTPLLEKTLDHPHSSISKPTIDFWNSSYGEQIAVDYDYPQNLLPVLHKLWRHGRIKLQKRCSWVEKCRKRRENTDHDRRYICRVTATSRSSKRIELMAGTSNQDMANSNAKRKKIELTEHQKEVRRAQQGKARDCGGHGPGVRTYTSLDFSQAADDSQESQDTQNLDSILELIRADPLI